MSEQDVWDQPNDLPSCPAGLQEAETALRWLAGLHAAFWEDVPGQDAPISHSSPCEVQAATVVLGGSSDTSVGQPPEAVWDQVRTNGALLLACRH